MEKLHVSVIQTHLFWEDIEANIKHFDQYCAAIADTDLVVLPEMFSTGFTMNPEKVAEQEFGLSFQWMKKTAIQKQIAITGSISTKITTGFVNRCYFFMPDGTYQFYDKRHLFRMGNEHHHYKAGDKKTIVHYKGWNILLQVCYDLRFPVFSRNHWDKNTKVAEYDLAIFVSNWPEVRNYAWSHLLVARAIENQAYVIGVNRIGEDGNKVMHSGDSVILDYLGKPLRAADPKREAIITSDLDKQELLNYREQFPVGVDADEFAIK
jgi:omega-amidase